MGKARRFHVVVVDGRLINLNLLSVLCAPRLLQVLTAVTFSYCYRFTQFWWVKRGSGKKEGRTFSRSLGLSAVW
jgi:hypothetical protein